MARDPEAEPKPQTGTVHMKVVVLTGPESSGKSTLGKALAKRFHAPVVGEYVREFIEEEQRDTCCADISTIAREA